MQYEKLAEVQVAGKNFARQVDLSRNSIAVVSFAGYAKLDMPLTSNLSLIEWAVDQLNAYGGTAMHVGLQAAEYALLTSPHPRHILIFTDGLPSSRDAAISAAQAIRHRGIQIMAIGTGDADRTCLEQMTGDVRLVLWARSGQFENAFQMAQRLIATASLVDASSGYTWSGGILRTGSWSSFLSFGLGLFLIAEQNRYQRRALLSRRDALLCIGGCIGVGLFSGCVGQSFFWLVRSDWAAHCMSSILLGSMLGVVLAVLIGLPWRKVALMAGIGAVVGVVPPICSRWFWFHVWGHYGLARAVAVLVWAGVGAASAWTICRLTCCCVESRTVLRCAAVSALASILVRVLEAYCGELSLLLTDGSTRFVAWSILGGALGAGLSYFIPNLNRMYAGAAGALSGVVSASLLLVVAPIWGEVGARLLGALALGYLMGMLIVIAEAACREQWLEVAYSAQDKRTINLGTQAVTVGGNVASRQPNGRPHASTALTYRVEKDAVVCQDAANGRICRVLPGQTRIVDGAQVTVRSRNA